MKPPALQPGDTIGIISPSFGAAGMFPERREHALKQIEALGFHWKLADHATNVCGYLSDSAENRAADIHAMFADPEVKAIIAAIGGDHACHLLPLLDFDLIRANPKIFMGFSDVTVLNVAIWQATSLVTFNGPALMTDFGEYPAMFDYTKRWIEELLISPHPPISLTPADSWTEEFLDWEQPDIWKNPRTMQPSDGWTWLKPGRAEGTLIGGCLESLQHLRGTRFWPDWQNAIFFWETAEEKPEPMTVDSLLMDYENMGVLDCLSGMLVGRPMKYSDEEKQEVREVILARTARYNFPVVTDMDFGHTSPQLVMPIGCRAEINTHTQQVNILEAAVTAP